MAEVTKTAEVIRVTRHPVLEIAEGIEVGGYTVYARLCAPADQYANGLFLVRTSRPELQHEKHLQMENGEFSFNCGEELKVGDRLEISISPAPQKNLRR